MRSNAHFRAVRTLNAGTSAPAEVLESRILLAAPVANDDAVATDENTVLMGDLFADNGSGVDSDADADPISVSAVNGNGASVGTMITLASGAKLTVNANGTFSYDPSGAFDSLGLGDSAMDTFTYRITDGATNSGIATVTVTVAGVNTPPVVSGEMFQTLKFSVVNGNLLANDSDLDGDTLTVSAVNGNGANVGTTVTLASGATLSVAAGGAFSYSAGGRLKRLEPGESGNDSFTYTVSDGHGGIGIATVTIRVDGEGVADIVGYANGNWQVAKSTGNAFTTSVWKTGPDFGYDAITYGDMNADGMTDVVTLLDGVWNVGLSNGTAFVFSTWAGWSDLAWTNVTVGDLNGDGRDDIMARIGGSWWAALSTGTTFATPSRWAGWSNLDWKQVSLTDLNADGRADLLAYIAGEWWVSLSNGTTFGAATRWAKWANLKWDGLGIFDVNNDGRTDIYGMYAGEWYVGQSSGTSFATTLRIKWSNVVWTDLRSGDFNGDGRDDLIARAGGSWWVSYSGMNLGGKGGATSLWTSWNDLNWVDVRVGDFNGDGQADIAGRYLGEWWVSRLVAAKVTTSRWATWSNITWNAVAAANFDGQSPQFQFGQSSLAQSPSAVNAAIWTQLSDDAEFAAKLLAS